MYSKTELTEIRKQIFPRYIGQNVISNSPNKSNGRLYKVSHKGDFGCFEDDKGEIHDFRFENLKLQLKPLSSITDEDAIVVSEMLGNQLDLEDWKDIIENEFYQLENYGLPVNTIFSLLQYLQLKGYALPQLVILNGKPITLSVEQQIESLIIETKN